MKSFTKSRAAAFGMAGALALGTVVSVGAIAPANAVDTSYTCTTSQGGLTFPVAVSNPFPSSGAVGKEIGAAPVKMDVSIPESTLGIIKLLLQGAGLPTTSLSGTISDAAMSVGDQKVPLKDLAAPSTAIPASGGMTLPIAGSTTAFTPDSGGAQTIGVPKNFMFTPAGVAAFEMPCALTSGAATKLGTMNVSGSSQQAASKTTATLKNAPITTSKHAKILAKVKSGGAAAAGKVIAKEGSKVLDKATLSGGKATLKLPLLSKGSHKIVVKYKGNATTEASKDTVKFSVSKG